MIINEYKRRYIFSTEMRNCLRRIVDQRNIVSQIITRVLLHLLSDLVDKYCRHSLSINLSELI